VARPGADDRLRRLLAIVPWIASHDGPTIAEVCERFDVTENELAADLELLWVCGLYPYTPDMLIDVDIDGDRVWIRYAEYFSRPLRLTPAEGLALVAAARAVLAVPGSDPEELCRQALPAEERRGDARRLGLLWQLVAIAAQHRMRNDASVDAAVRAIGYQRLGGYSSASGILDWALILGTRSAEEGLRILDELERAAEPAQTQVTGFVLDRRPHRAAVDRSCQTTGR